MGGGLAGRCARLKPTVGSAIATHSQQRFVANCSELKDRHCERSEAIHSPHMMDRHTREGGYPVRRGLSVQSLLPLEYWIVRPSAQVRTRRTMTTEYDAAVSRRDAPELLMTSPP